MQISSDNFKLNREKNEQKVFFRLFETKEFETLGKET